MVRANEHIQGIGATDWRAPAGLAASNFGTLVREPVSDSPCPLPALVSLSGFHCLFRQPTPAQVAAWVRLLGSKLAAGRGGLLFYRVKEVIHQAYVPRALQESTPLDLPYSNILLILN